MTNEEIQAQDDEDLKAWNTFCKEHPRSVVKAMTVFEVQMAKRYTRRPVFNVLLEAMWMSFLVFTCIHAFAPMVGSFVAMVIGGGMCVLVHKVLQSTSVLFVEFFQKRMLKKLDEVTKDGARNDSSDDTQID